MDDGPTYVFSFGIFDDFFGTINITGDFFAEELGWFVIFLALITGFLSDIFEAD